MPRAPGQRRHQDVGCRRAKGLADRRLKLTIIGCRGGAEKQHGRPVRVSRFWEISTPGWKEWRSQHADEPPVSRLIHVRPRPRPAILQFER